MSSAAILPRSCEMSVTAPVTSALSRTLAGRNIRPDAIAVADWPCGISWPATSTDEVAEPELFLAELMAMRTSTAAATAAAAAIASAPERLCALKRHGDLLVSSIVVLLLLVGECAD